MPLHRCQWPSWGCIYVTKGHAQWMKAYPDPHKTLTWTMIWQAKWRHWQQIRRLQQKGDPNMLRPGSIFTSFDEVLLDYGIMNVHHSSGLTIAQRTNPVFANPNSNGLNEEGNHIFPWTKICTVNTPLLPPTVKPSKALITIVPHNAHANWSRIRELWL